MFSKDQTLFTPVILLWITLWTISQAGSDPIFRTGTVQKHIKALPLYDEDTQTRNYSFPVNFGVTFNQVPKMALSIIGMNLTGTKQNVYVSASNIGLEGFTLEVSVFPSNVIEDILVSYMATIWGKFSLTLY